MTLPPTPEQAWSLEGADWALEARISHYRRRVRLDELVVGALEEDARERYLARGSTPSERAKSVIEEMKQAFGGGSLAPVAGAKDNEAATDDATSSTSSGDPTELPGRPSTDALTGFDAPEPGDNAVYPDGGAAEPSPSVGDAYPGDSGTDDLGLGL